MNTEKDVVSSSRTPGEYSNWWLVQSEHAGTYVQALTPPNAPPGRWRVLPVPEAVIQEVPDHERHVWTSRLALEETDVYLEGHRIFRRDGPLAPADPKQRIYESYAGTPDRIGMIGKHPIMLDLKFGAPAPAVSLQLAAYRAAPGVSSTVERPRLSFIRAAWRLACRLWDLGLTVWHRVFHPVGIGFPYSGARFCLQCRRYYPAPFAPDNIPLKVYRT